jgi:glycosyltransferase involved in cell wall biosynthesis
MRIVFYYTSLSSGQPTGTNWARSEQRTQHPLFTGFPTEGLAWLLEQLKRTGVIDDYIVVLESANSPGRGTLPDGSSWFTVPHINDTLSLLQEGDVIWARGGFRPWPPFLEQMNKEGRWVLFYRAATNRGGWPYWDVILDDLIETAFQDERKRLFLPFHKPVRPEYFSPDYRQVPVYDVVLNASHIHDRKGQYKGILAAIEYQKMFGKKLRVLLPGSYYHGFYTNQIYDWVEAYQLAVTQPGMVPRQRVGVLMNQCKLYVHLGGGGQNDRGALEALRCGLPVVIGSPNYFPPFMSRAPHSIIIPDYDNPYSVANALKNKLDNYLPQWKRDVAEYYDLVNGDNVTVNCMKELLTFIAANPRPDRAKIGAYYCR